MDLFLESHYGDKLIICPVHRKKQIAQRLAVSVYMLS